MTDAILSDIFPPESKRLCEWDVWGHVGQEVYVWALCEVNWSDQVSGGSVPAVLYLAPDGTIEKVVMPRDGIDYPPDIRKLFPPDVQTRIHSHDFDVEAAKEHIALRRRDSDIPPMIVEAGTPLP
ncbi:MAG: hypothetical protein SXV54_21740 [Chloroflexota bacterium]|nr:hypothetical protein [Chloroflexota bacterium]